VIDDEARAARRHAAHAVAAGAGQQFGRAQFAIKDDDGDLIASHALSAAQMAEVARLPGLVDVGGPRSDVTLYQFYDLNCPYCREAATDVDKLLRSDPALRLVFVPYPVLSAQSVEGARIELAVRAVGTPQNFLEFHRRIYASRGVIDGARALAVAADMKFDLKTMVEVANTRQVTDTMAAHARLGSALGLAATPAYVVNGVALSVIRGRSRCNRSSCRCDAAER
jgi:protein-disulfide isomerase